MSGSFWYAAGATIQILLFSMIAVQLKIRAPGAKTFLQVVKARFGSRTHLVFCGFALMTNLIVTALLMLGELAKRQIPVRSGGGGEREQFGCIFT